MSALSRTGAVVVRAQRRFRARPHGGAGRWRLRLAAALLVVIGIGATGWFVANSSLVALHYVTVEGTSRLTPAEVLTAAKVRQGTSLVRLDPGAVARRVQRLRPVARALVSRHWPHGLVIRVVERKPAAVVDDDGRVELLDRTGVAFASAASAPPGLVRVDVAAPVPGAGDPAARAAMRVLAQLPAHVRAAAKTVTATSPLAVSVRLADGRTVIWGSASDGATKSAVLRTLMHRSARVYDVSVPTVAVTRG